MSLNTRDRATPEEIAHVEHKLLQGVVSRTASLCYIWAIVAFAYGFASLEIIQIVKPEMNLYDNLWPRLVFNSIPALLLGFWFSRYQVHTKLKAFSSAIILPSLLASAACVYVWPLFWLGHHNLYLYFHASNIVAFSTALAISSGTPRVVLSQIIGFFIIFWCPVFYMLMKNPDSLLTIKVIANDFLFASLIFTPGLYGLHKLRKKLAMADLRVKQLTQSFLGSPLTNAIYEDGVEGLANFTRSGIILAIDLRGYTNFVHNSDAVAVKDFMRKYHRVVSQAVGNNNGFLHKSSGDGHIISFGIMEPEADLSDLPGYEGELNRSNEMKKYQCFLNTIKTFAHMLMEFEKIKKESSINVPLLVGAGIAFGPVEVVLRGDSKYRQELDIDGETIVRAVRLESYSKFLNTKVDNDSSFLIISPELGTELKGVPGVHTWSTVDEAKIRDYPWIKAVYFRQWKHNRKRSGTEQAA